MYDDWPPKSHAITVAEGLRPLLCRHGVEYRAKGGPRQIRACWPLIGGTKNPWVAILYCADGGRAVRLKLRVSRDSGLLKPDGPLDRSADWDRTPSERDTGSFPITAVFPTDLQTWIDAAFSHCAERYPIELDAQPAAETAPPVSRPNQQLTVADTNAPPADRVVTTVARIVRDTELANWVKEQHGRLCQLCGETVRLADGSGYAEGHHLQPLGSPHDGSDVAENILCVCPNHHAACDLGAIRLTVADLRPAAKHTVGQQFLDYHNRVVYRGST